jgi:hypothetical protein
LRIKEQETHLTLLVHDDDNYDEANYSDVNTGSKVGDIVQKDFILSLYECLCDINYAFVKSAAFFPGRMKTQWDEGGGGITQGAKRSCSADQVPGCWSLDLKYTWMYIYTQLILCVLSSDLRNLLMKYNRL